MGWVAHKAKMTLSQRIQWLNRIVDAGETPGPRASRDANNNVCGTETTSLVEQEGVTPRAGRSHNWVYEPRSPPGLLRPTQPKSPNTPTEGAPEQRLMVPFNAQLGGCLTPSAAEVRDDDL